MIIEFIVLTSSLRHLREIRRHTYLLWLLVWKCELLSSVLRIKISMLSMPRGVFPHITSLKVYIFNSPYFPSSDLSITFLPLKRSVFVSAYSPIFLAKRNLAFGVQKREPHLVGWTFLGALLRHLMSEFQKKALNQPKIECPVSFFVVRLTGWGIV
jgi:hypothetical protein